MNDIKNLVNESLIKAKQEQAKREKYISIIKYISSIILPTLIVFIILNVFIGIATIKGSSMEKGLHENDIILFNRLDKTIDRFDIIVAKKIDQNMYIIKRVIGLPNDTIDIKDGYVFVNNTQIDESSYTENGTTYLQDISFPITLSDDEYFLLGDNREVSLDSRNSETGLINKKNIFGKILFVFRGLK
ncbi:MAG: signal peptidase I [Erysipelotrichaceae bacterium]|nr:signal peptidase I [Erysipelotrichaceae bacterium]